MLPSVATVLCEVSFLVSTWESESARIILRIFQASIYSHPENTSLLNNLISEAFDYIDRGFTAHFLLIKRLRAFTTHSTMLAFLDLPLEIREKIYGTIFPHPKYVNDIRDNRPFTSIFPKYAISNILLASRQINKEAIHFLYSHRAIRNLKDAFHCEIPFPLVNSGAASQRREISIEIRTPNLRIEQKNSRNLAVERDYNSIIRKLAQLSFPGVPLIVTFLGDTLGYDITFFLVALRQLVAFEAVSVRPRAVKRPRCVRGRPPLRQNRYERLRDQAAELLSSTFGPGVFCEDKEGAFCVNFEPRKNAAITAIEEKSALINMCGSMKKMQLES